MTRRTCQMCSRDENPGRTARCKANRGNRCPRAAADDDPHALIVELTETTAAELNVAATKQVLDVTADLARRLSSEAGRWIGR